VSRRKCVQFMESFLTSSQPYVLDFDALLGSLLAFVVNLAEISNDLHSSVLGREIENVGSVEFVNALKLSLGRD